MRGMQVSPFGMMAKCALLAGGMESSYFPHKGPTVLALLTFFCRIRLYSTKSFKPLGTLDYHKKSVTALAFAHPPDPIRPKPTITDEYDSEDEMLPDEYEARGRWLAAGSEDTRLSIWPLITFSRQS